jgi:nitrite reductase (NO-forming)
MLAIIIGIMIVGGIIFFTHWGYWTSYTPIAGVKQQEWMANEPDTGCPSIPCPTNPPQAQTTAVPKQGTFTGKPINVELKFAESSDFSKLGFNAPVSQPDANPEIHANVGDKIIFDVKNAGKSFHAFAITTSEKGPGPAIPDTTIGTADNPMKPGDSGQVSFVPAGPGEYYYICAVPGHRELGMNGKIEVTAEGGGGAAGTGATVAPTGNKAEFSLSFSESSDFSKLGFNAPVGQPGANPDIKVKSGDTVTIHIKNAGKSFHAFGIVSDPGNPTSIVWNAKFKDPNDPIKPGESGDVTFVAGSPGTYHYICTVPGHAALGMNGNFIVEP